jgi:predicted nucleic acid-binding protein
MASESCIRLVLDTNAGLDLFVFNDRVGGPLRALLEAGRARAVTDGACRAEWRRVLRYPHLGFEAERVAAAEAAFDALVSDWPAAEAAIAAQAMGAAGPIAAGGRVAAPGLPRCKDPDDQKFLELAARCGARVLVTRDASLLRLSKRAFAVAGFVVLPPQATVALLEAV